MSKLLWPEGRENTQPVQVGLHAAEDLQLDRICAAFSPDNYHRLTTRDLCDFLTADPTVIKYRQDTVADLCEHPDFVDFLTRLLDYIDAWEACRLPERAGYDSASGSSWNDLSILDSCTEQLGMLHRSLAEYRARFASPALLALADEISALADDARFSLVSRKFPETCGGYVYPSGILLGFNLTENSEISALKLLRIESMPNAKKPSKKTVKDNPSSPFDLESGIYPLEITPALLRGATALLQRSAATAATEGVAYVKEITSPLRALRKDIIFYSSACRLRKMWLDAGMPCCFPDILPSEDKAFTADKLYNPLLVLGGKSSANIVTNTVTFEKGGEIIILTGANQGGKTTFLVSVALAQFLFQLGMPVPAASAAISPCGGISTVFAPSGVQTTHGGRLAEECARIAAAVAEITPNSAVFFNEPLNATSPSENLSISRDVLSVLKASGVRGIWVTHIYELAAERGKLSELIPWGSTLGSMRVRVELHGELAEPLYKAERGEPEFRSYAAEVLRQKGYGTI